MLPEYVNVRASFIKYPHSTKQNLFQSLSLFAKLGAKVFRCDLNFEKVLLLFLEAIQQCFKWNSLQQVPF